MKWIFAAAFFVGSLCAGIANAATVSGVYYGELTDSSNSAFPYLSVGDTYRIEFSYDTSVPDSNPAVWVGQYDGAASGRVVFSNGFWLTFAGAGVGVSNDREPGDYDGFGLGSESFASSNFPKGLYSLSWFGTGLLDFTRAVLSSDKLPESYLSSDLFNGENTFEIDFDGLGVPGVGMYGTLSSTPAPTPVPAALPLFAAALGGLGLAAWRRRVKLHS